MNMSQKKSYKWYLIHWKNRFGEDNSLPVEEDKLPKYVEIFWNEGRFPTIEAEK